ncbi:hypothetical protein H6G91_17615 [Nostoc muscorum FACHB-395]|nr:hypothetical protein [Desmonostoc muscorum FACHB-395]
MQSLLGFIQSCPHFLNSPKAIATNIFWLRGKGKGFEFTFPPLLFNLSPDQKRDYTDLWGDRSHNDKRIDAKTYFSIWVNMRQYRHERPK